MCYQDQQIIILDWSSKHWAKSKGNIKILSSKMKLFSCQGFFSKIKISEIGIQIYLSIQWRQNAASPVIESARKSIKKLLGLTTPFRKRGNQSKNKKKRLN